MNGRVGMCFDPDSSYPQEPPFHPSEQYPEYRFGAVATSRNCAYEAVRVALVSAGFDETRFDTPAWNPLGEIVSPGSRVLIKPNLVVSQHPLGQVGMDASVAHGSVIRAVLDYVLIALDGRGSVVVGDSPIKEVDFDRVTRANGLQPVVDWYGRRGLEITLRDLRDTIAYRDKHGVIHRVDPIEDPVGSTAVDLGTASALEDTPIGRVRSTAAVYQDESRKVHGPGRHLYAVSNAAMHADAIISLCKPKTHVKTGVTLAIKNFVGTTNNKEWLPHFRHGTPRQGGDRLSDNAPVKRRLQEAVKELIWTHGGPRAHGLAKRAWTRGVGTALQATVPQGAMDYGSGDWYGNDTAWRMSIDTAVAALYGRPDGTLSGTPARNVLHIADGIVAGEGNGPLEPVPRPFGLVAASTDAVALDTCCIYLMGFEPADAPTLSGIAAAGRSLGTTDEEHMDVVVNGERKRPRELLDFGVRFVPADAWAATMAKGRLTGRIDAGSPAHYPPEP